MDVRATASPISSETADDPEPLDFWGWILLGAAIVVENAKLLVIGPILAGLIAVLAVNVLPQTYTSQAYLGSMTDAAAKGYEMTLRSPRALDPVLQKFTDFYAGEPAEKRRAALNARIAFGVVTGGDRRTGALYVLGISDRSPARAQQIAVALLDSLIVAMKPEPDARMRLEASLQAYEAQLASANAVIAELEKAPGGMTPTVTHGALTLPINDLLKLRTETLDKIEEIKAYLRGASRDIIFSPPNLPEVPWPNPWYAIAVAVLAIFALLLVGVFIAFSLRRSAGREANVATMRRIHASAPPWRRGRRIEKA